MSLSLDDQYIRNPRQFALALRDRLRPHIPEGQEGEREVEVFLRRRERVAFHDTLFVPANTDRRSVLVVRYKLLAATGSSFQEVWVQGDAELGAGVAVRGLACDENLHLGRGCTVGRWIDTEHDAFVESGCDLGTSATATGTLTISPGCTFRRLWGQPIRTLGDPVSAAAGGRSLSIEDEVVWAGDRLSIPPGAHFRSGIVAHGALHIGSGAVLGGTVKADGELVIGDSVQIDGNVIGRRSVQLGRGSHVDGNVFAERDVRVGAEVTIGREGGYKTIYAARNVVLGARVSVYGWVVAERAGRVEEL